MWHYAANLAFKQKFEKQKQLLMEVNSQGGFDCQWNMHTFANQMFEEDSIENPLKLTDSDESIGFDGFRIICNLLLLVIAGCVRVLKCRKP